MKTETFKYGPLSVDITSFGEITTDWHSAANAYDVVVRDEHGQHFYASWISANDSPEWIAQTMLTLLDMSTWRRDPSIDYDGDFVEYFSGGYLGAEKRWRAEEARKIRKSAVLFKSEELLKAAAKAARQRSYNDNRGPKDWSPIGEIRE